MSNLAALQSQMTGIFQRHQICRQLHLGLKGQACVALALVLAPLLLCPIWAVLCHDDVSSYDNAGQGCLRYGFVYNMLIPWSVRAISVVTLACFGRTVECLPSCIPSTFTYGFLARAPPLH